MVFDKSTAHVVLSLFTCCWRFFNDRLVGDLKPVGLGVMMMAAIMKVTPAEKKSQNRRHLQASTYQMNSLMCHFWLYLVAPYFPVSWRCWKYTSALCKHWMKYVLQVSDPDIIDLIRKKKKLRLPYAGAFLKKTERWIFSLLWYK